MQNRTHNCNELIIKNVGEEVRLVGWYENLRKVSRNATGSPAVQAAFNGIRI